VKTPTIEFGGVEYLHGSASDPNALGLMQGSPPPAGKRIRFEDDRYLEFPQNRWSLSHMRELVPTTAVWRGNGTASPLGAAPRDGEARIDTLTFDDLQGGRHSWADSLAYTYTDGIIFTAAAASLLFFDHQVLRGDAGGDSDSRAGIGRAQAGRPLPARDGGHRL
jgi:hypothetical protein